MSSASPRRHRIAFAGTVVLLALGAGMRVCEGAERCRVEVADPVAGEWKTAALKLAQDLDTGPWDSDCLRVELHADGDHTVVTYVTRDGRRADRQLETPEELAPTVAALRTTVPRDSAPQGLGAFSDDVDADRATQGLEQKGARAQGAGIVLSLGTGVRMGSSALVSPTVEGRAAVWLRDWELGVMARSEARYYEVRTAGEPQARRGASAGGFNVGRRLPVGGNIALLGGTSLLLAVIDHPDAETERDENGVEGRLGGYFGLVFPRNAAVRFRASVAGEVVPHRLGQPLRNSQGVAVSPWWAFGLTMGIEVGR